MRTNYHCGILNRTLVGTNEKAFRYYRFVSSEQSKNSNAATIRFLGTTRHSINEVESASLPISSMPNSEEKKIDSVQLCEMQGMIIGDDIGYAFDNNPETYSLGNWTGLDFGSMQPIEQILFIPRNANNGINSIDLYELFYWDGKWISVGIETGDDGFVSYRNVPSNTIYWLRNIDKGVEEMPFIFQDGTQYFANFDSLGFDSEVSESFYSNLKPQESTDN